MYKIVSVMCIWEITHERYRILLFSLILLHKEVAGCDSAAMIGYRWCDSLLCLVKKSFNIQPVRSLALVLELQLLDNSSKRSHRRRKSL